MWKIVLAVILALVIPTSNPISSAAQVQFRCEIKYTEPTGVVGVRNAPDGTVLDIYPYSRATEVGLRVGDVVVTVDQKPFVYGKPYQDACRGIPGTRVIFGLRDGRMLAITRVDYRKFLNEDQYYWTLK